MTAVLPVDAQFFFYQFTRLLQHVLLELQGPDVSPRHFQLLLQFGSIKVWRGFLLAFHGGGCVVAEQL